MAFTSSMLGGGSIWPDGLGLTYMMRGVCKCCTRNTRLSYAVSRRLRDSAIFSEPISPANARHSSQVTAVAAAAAAWCCALSARLSGAELRTFAQRHKGFLLPPLTTHKPLIASFACFRGRILTERDPVRGAGRTAFISVYLRGR